MVTAWPPGTQAGGIGTVIRTLAKELSPDFRIAVLVNDWSSRRLQYDDGPLRIYRLRMRVPYDRLRPLAGVLGWLRDGPGTVIQLWRLIRTEGFAVVHLHYPSAYQFYFRVLRLLGGPPYVVTLHRGETIRFGELSSIEKTLTRWTLRGAAGVVAVSRWLAELAKQTFQGVEDIGCIYNGLIWSELDRLGHDSAAQRPQIDLPDRFCLIVANVAYYKGQDTAIRAWAEIRPRLPDLHLVIVGEQREHWDTCVRLIEQLNCADRVHMIGPLAREEVFRLMKRATALIFPSRNEGLGLVLLEAGAVGLPVVCSRIGPFMEIAKDEESALMVAPEDPTGLGQAVVRLAEDGDLRKRLSEALSRRVRTVFSASAMAEQYEALYRAAIGGPAVAGRKRSDARGEGSRSA